MPPTESLTKLLSQAVEAASEKDVVDALTALIFGDRKAQEELTIVSNEGMHKIPDVFLHGEVYIASGGNIDLSSRTAIHDSYALVLRSLAEKLREKPWTRIYLIPTGPTTLGLQIKLLVYHITRLSTIDLFYSRGDYYELELDYRTYLNLRPSNDLGPLKHPRP